ncbi:hypothetical protein ACA910_011252 [Epithemia clementina (nom. ined.)]
MWSNFFSDSKGKGGDLPEAAAGVAGGARPPPRQSDQGQQQLALSPNSPKPAPSLPPPPTSSSLHQHRQPQQQHLQQQQPPPASSLAHHQQHQQHPGSLSPHPPPTQTSYSLNPQNMVPPPRSPHRHHTPSSYAVKSAAVPPSSSSVASLPLAPKPPDNHPPEVPKFSVFMHQKVVDASGNQTTGHDDRIQPTPGRQNEIEPSPESSENSEVATWMAGVVGNEQDGDDDNDNNVEETNLVAATTTTEAEEHWGAAIIAQYQRIPDHLQQQHNHPAGQVAKDETTLRPQHGPMTNTIHDDDAYDDDSHGDPSNHVDYYENIQGHAQAHDSDVNQSYSLHALETTAADQDIPSTAAQGHRNLSANEQETGTQPYLTTTSTELEENNAAEEVDEGETNERAAMEDSEHGHLETVADEGGPDSCFENQDGDDNSGGDRNPDETHEENESKSNGDKNGYQEQQKQNEPERALVVVKSSTFHFVGDEQRVEKEWNYWELVQNSQRQEWKRRIHSLQCKTAQILARVATENMERHRCLERPFLKVHVFEPLNLLVDRVAMQRDEYRYDTTENNRSPDLLLPLRQSEDTKRGSMYRWKHLDSRLSALDTHMTRSMHEQLPQARRQQLTNLMVELLAITKEGKQRRLEAAKAEADLARKIEDVAGRVLCGPYREEHAARCTSLELIKQAVDLPEKLGEDECRKMTQEIKRLRQDLARQRQERKEQDEWIQQLIETKAVAMQRALIEAVGDPNE